MKNASSQVVIDTHVDALKAIPRLIHGFGRRSIRPETRAVARKRCALRLAPFGRVYFLTQVHGDCIVHTPFRRTPQADGAIVTMQGLLVAVETADCLPIILVEPRRHIAAIVHAGWRGTAKSIVARAIKEMLGTGDSPVRIVAALGPCIGSCCYEIGEELLAPRGPFGAPFVRRNNDRYRLDLRSVNQRQLEREGVPAESIFHVSECTHCRADIYHSYRRDGRNTGRMISYVGWADSAEI